MRALPCSVAIAALGLLALRPAALANDSMAEVAIGGLTLTESNDISMDSEDLFISREEVRVDYRFTNTSDRDIEALVAFPLPDQKSDPETLIHSFGTELKFKTLVDGTPVPLEVVEQGIVNGKDVTARIKQLGFTVTGASEWPVFDRQMKALSADDLKAALAEGVLFNMGGEDYPDYYPGWTMRTTMTRTQVFPAGKTISVQHSYAPVVGGSVGGNFNKQYRNETWQKEHAADYCIEDSWFAGFDKAVAKYATEMNPAPYSEFWIGYVLKSGANWKGPIKDFRLVVDKGAPENLVSFCAEGVKKIAPTRFEVRKTNFEPDKDIKILIVDWIEGEQ